MNTETKLPRLIDANAFIEQLKNEVIRLKKLNYEVSDVLHWIELSEEIIQYAPTVETTDDVLARLSEKEWLTSLKKMWDEWVARYYPTAEEMDFLTSPTNGFWNTPLEAIKKLEASINQK